MITRNEGGFHVEGPVTMDSVRQLLEEGNKLFNHGEVEVDFGGVTEVDSTAVSLMLNWLREGEKRSQQLRFVNVPENLKSLAAMYGVQDLINPT